MNRPSPLLEGIHVKVVKGGSLVLDIPSLQIESGEILALVGPNGAGKTTLVKSILGLLKVRTGRITFLGHDITNLSTHRIARLGIGYVPEDRRIYPDFTVEENILLATWRSKVNTGGVLETVYALFPQLRELRLSRGINLSGGEQSMLAIARTLALQPRCLLLDEPLEGLAPVMRKRVAQGIKELKAEGLSTLTTASDVSYVPDMADMVYTMERGEVVKEENRR
jgi:branched-chain amino acid transport system ATP-binding protein